MNAPSQIQSVRKLFEPTLDGDDVEAIVAGLASLDAKALAAAVNVGLILSDFSLKGAAEYFRVVPKVLQTVSPEELGPWVGMGIQIAQHSSGAGIRFFKQGPAIFSRIASRPVRERFIQEGMTIAEQDYNLAVEYYQQAPTLLAEVALTPEAFSKWAEQGVALGKEDYTLAVEYFRVTPALLRFLPMPLLPEWAAVGKKLTAGKLLPALLFIRSSPEIFSKIGSDADRTALLNLTSEVAEQAPPLAGKLFSESADVLPPFQALHLETVLLERAAQIARFDGELAAAFFLNGPKILKEMGPLAHQFPAWVDQGMAVLKKDPAAAKGFFSFESKSARQAVDQLRGGISLSAVSRPLKLFAEGLSGKPVAIQPTSSLKEETEKKESGGDLPTTDGYTIYLPAHVGRFSSDALNFEWYKIATAFQAGYLEFGTFSPRLSETADLIESLQAKYRTRGGLKTLSAFFTLFPEPAFIKQLFEIAEGSRIEFRLREEYPGLRAALSRMREADFDRRPPLVGLTPRGVVVEFLQQVSLAGKTKEPIPQELQSILFEVCRIMGMVQSPDATVAASMTAAARAYDFLQEEGDLPRPSDRPMEAFEDAGPQMRGEGPGGGEIRPSTRGTLDPERVEGAKRAVQSQAEGLLKKLKESGIDLSSEAVESALAASVQRGEVTIETLRGADAADPLDRIMEKFQAGRAEQGRSGRKEFFYDEWDCEADDYRPGWCRVSETTVSPEEGESVAAILSEYAGLIQSVQTAFQYLRPEGLKRIKGERDGDELDLDALLSSRVEARAGRSPSDRIYIQRQKKERSVAAAFLIDLSGSTQQRLRSGEKSILQIEKEALVILARAVDAVGDRFALYGFSGRGKEGVDFYILKEFEERYTGEIDRRIGQVTPAIQNRDGAAIRHAAVKLAAQPSKIKTLVLLSDGKPLDDDYRGSYATADTKMALREAKRLGVHPYCITVDREGEEYLKGMYGEVAYMVIDQVESLPAKLPQIYKRLTT